MTFDDFFKNAVLDKTSTASALRNKIFQLVEQYFALSHKNKTFVPNQTLVPTSGKVYDEKEMQLLISASLDFWLTTGRFNAEFEKQLANFTGLRTALTTNSGSSANLLALSALTSKQLGNDAIKPDDEVITVAAGFPTTVNPIIQNNLIPVFVDVQIPTYVIDPTQIEDAITTNTKAIVVAHTLGNPFDISKVSAIAEKYDLWLIEDCCDALGSTYDGKHVGSFGDLATLSFYPAHQITMGEGGAVLTNNPKLKNIVESFRDWGRDCFCAPGMSNSCGKRFGWKLGDLPAGYDHKYTYSNIGYNLKITDMQAAIGLAQLQKLPEFIRKRKNNFQILKDNLKPVSKFLVLPESTEKSDPSWFGFPITISEQASFSREDLIFFLMHHKIDTRPIFAGNLTKQPYLKNVSYKQVGNLINTDIIMNRSFWLGVYPGLTQEMLEHVSNTIIYFIKSHTN